MTRRPAYFAPDADDAFLADAMPVVAALLERHDPARVRLTGLRPAEWSTDAACVGQVGPDLDPWYPEPEWPARDRRAATALAREVCESCPVRAQCLALGLAMIPLDGAHGMFAGFTPVELRAIAGSQGMARRVVAQHGTRSRYVAGCTDGREGGPCGPCARAHNEWVKAQRVNEAAPLPMACDAPARNGPCRQPVTTAAGCPWHPAAEPVAAA